MSLTAKAKLQCPVGDVCMSSTNFTIVILLLIALIVGILFYRSYKCQHCQAEGKKCKDCKHKEVSMPLPMQMPMVMSCPRCRQYHGKFESCPALDLLPWVQPLQKNPYGNLNNTVGLPIVDIATRRPFSTGFSQVGFVSRKKGSKMMPLYSRQIDNYKYEYYVINTETNVKIPVYNKNDTELNTNDEIFIEGFNKYYKVNIYNMDSPRYSF